MAKSLQVKPKKRNKITNQKLTQQLKEERKKQGTLI